ncbi:MAG: RND transporter [Ruminococcus sp.]|uniref:RND transporter n=1 Tax=Ruminococcus sp. TaxID=41978 RepID=UPI0025E3BA93|nr:RND transporter [Ruminococcus sp.]MCR5600305.1 RND transporter [Ruminococcus sp.]
MNEKETKEINSVLLKDDEKSKMSPEKKRDIIKNVIIIFLVIMLVLTFFSNTIMNKSLPEITTETISSGKLTECIRDRGVVESNQSYEVMVDGNKVIEKIHIKTGSEVKKGDVLFTVKNVSDDKLDEEEAALDAAKLEYETALLKAPVDYSSENQEIKAAREELNAAIAKRDAARVNDSNYEAAKSRYNADKSELSALTEKKENIKMALKAINSDMFDGEVPVEYLGDLASRYSAYVIIDEEYKAAYELYEKAVEKGENAEIAKADADAKQAVRRSAKEAYDSAKEDRRSELMSQLNDLEQPIADLTGRVEEFNSQYGESGGNTYDALAEAVVEKRNSLEKLIITLDKTKADNNLADRKSNLELESKKKALDKQQEKFDKLKKDASSVEVKSKYSGVVSNIDVKPDDQTVEGKALATIDLVDEGFTLKLTVDAEKTKKIKKGVEAEVLNFYNGDVTAVLSEIRSDASKGSKKKELVFDITGDVNSGDSLNLSIPCGSGTYDAIVPKSAVKTDDNETFVLVVRSKSTPLGNRYYAEKVVVNEEATDEVSSAVSGGLSRGDYVITASSKPIKPGDQVRMQDK